MNDGLPPVASNLERTRRGPLVLLFYDGFELRAADGPLNWSASQLRRVARHLYRSALGKQVRTGFYTQFLALAQSLRLAGCDVRINDFRSARARPSYPVGLSGYPSVTRLPLDNPVVFGPGSAGTPADERALAERRETRFMIQFSDWISEYNAPFCGAKMRTWFAGIDHQRWYDASDQHKQTDVLIYDKIRWYRDTRVPLVLDRLCSHLSRRGLSFQILRYGEHNQRTFAKALRASRSLAFLCEHETQGIAYQEALASNVPVFAWDQGELVDFTMKRFQRATVIPTSVPYFSPQCGERFKADEMESRFDQFWDRLGDYAPRRYVRENLTLQQSAMRYLEIYGEAAGAIEQERDSRLPDPVLSQPGSAAV